MKGELHTLFRVWDMLLQSGHAIPVDDLNTALGRISCTVFKADERRFIARLNAEQSDLRADEARSLVNSVKNALPDIASDELPLAVFFDRNTGCARLGLHAASDA